MSQVKVENQFKKSEDIKTSRIYFQKHHQKNKNIKQTQYLKFFLNCHAEILQTHTI